MELKFCKDCIHFISMYGSGQESRCFRPRKIIVDLVSGRESDNQQGRVWDAKSERNDGGSCGQTGIFWRKKV